MVIRGEDLRRPKFIRPENGRNPSVLSCSKSKSGREKRLRGCATSRRGEGFTNVPFRVSFRFVSRAINRSTFSFPFFSHHRFSPSSSLTNNERTRGEKKGTKEKEKFVDDHRRSVNGDRSILRFHLSFSLTVKRKG